MSIPAELRRRAEEWVAGDPDSTTVGELRALIDAGDATALSERVGGSLVFGTAGLRAAVGAGPLRMNRAVVIRTTRGLADHVLASDPRAMARPVVVGFDARTDSRRFAEDVVAVLAGAGLAVRWFPEPTATPLVAYAARILDACAAVVVTASHNPPSDNGYKVYGPNAAQIVPPDDAAIAAAIDAVGPAAEVPRVGASGSDLIAELGADLVAAYRRDIAAARPTVAGGHRPRIVYTPLHGVGRDPVLAALADAGHHDVHVVGEQAEPDGAFPTVAFPNPEEPGALDLALALARQVDADLLVASDPDVDRLAVAVPTRRSAAATDAAPWRTLSGNQIGVLLADHLLAHSRAERPLVVNSVVSTPHLASVAAARGARFETTLTGFKWICDAALGLADEGYELVLGFEEALGYSVGSVVRDKDGIAAAVVFADLVATLADAGRTVEDRLDALHRRDGLWVGAAQSVVRPGVDGVAEIAAAMDHIGPRRAPEQVNGLAVVDVVDYRVGGEERPRWLGTTPLVELRLAGGGRALVRPSGTEPKLKVYVDLRADAGDDLDAQEADLLERARGVAAHLLDFLGLV